MFYSSGLERKKNCEPEDVVHCFINIHRYQQNNVNFHPVATNDVAPSSLSSLPLPLPLELLPSSATTVIVSSWPLYHQSAILILP
jgi:hypothetical protein